MVAIFEIIYDKLGDGSLEVLIDVAIEYVRVQLSQIYIITSNIIRSPFVLQIEHKISFSIRKNTWMISLKTGSISYFPSFVNTSLDINYQLPCIPLAKLTEGIKGIIISISILRKIK